MNNNNFNVLNSTENKNDKEKNNSINNESNININNINNSNINSINNNISENLKNSQKVEKIKKQNQFDTLKINTELNKLGDDKIYIINIL